MRIAINGFGRIGRAILRALHENKKYSKHIQCVAINCGAISDVTTVLHLLKHDSTHGYFPGVEMRSGKSFTINGHEVAILSEPDITKLDWGVYDIDVLLECTGKFTTREQAALHLNAGAKRVVVSAPCKDADATIVFQVNDADLKEKHRVISIGSCTTNCLAPIARILHDTFEIESGFMTTIHAYTNDQALLDGHHNDPRRARSAALSMIPSTTGAAKAIGLVIPELAGRLDGTAIRVPVANVSMLDLTINISKKCTIDEVHTVIEHASQHHMHQVLGYTIEPLVSVDFNHNPLSSIFDATQTKLSSNGTMLKIAAWYDNEWGFANRMLDISILYTK